ncbi:MAG: efflux RND transporter periplasmic adaptor subunit [Kiritimatiellia bacterium]
MKQHHLIRQLGLIGLMSVNACLYAQETYEGLVEPVRDVLMGPPVAGRVEQLLAGEGDRVKAGDTLLRLHDAVERLEVKRRELVLDDQAELEAARHRRDLLKDDLESTRNLFETTASVSRDELARKTVEALLSEVEYGRLEQVERREEAELAIAKERLAQYSIIAPFDGVLAELSVDEGESVQAGQPVLRFVDVSSAYLVLNLPAELVSSLQEGKKVTLNFDRTRELRKPAEVTFISPVIDPASGLRKVKMRFKNDPPRVEPGRIGTWTTAGDADE